MTEFSVRVIKIIKSIPYGKVLSYGKIALLAGSPHGARQVGWLLNSSSSKYGLPWHRVVNSKGKISLNEESFIIQKDLLICEGVEFKNNNTVDMSKHIWDVNFIDFDQIYLEEI